jgi:hypothetical protein
MFVVHKFSLKHGSQQIGLPVGAEVLAMGEQRGGLVMWVKVPRDMPTSQAVLLRTLIVLRTGEECAFETAAAKYIDSVQGSDGLMYHLFEEGWKPLPPHD